MTMKTQFEPLSRSPKYPENAYMTFLFSHGEAEELTVYPISTIYTNLNEVSAFAREFQENLEKGEEQQKSIFESAAIIPIHFVTLFELKPEYWQNPSVHFDASDRAKQFIHVLSHPTFFTLLVTPSRKNEKDEEFIATIPYPITATDRDIERFMTLTDFPVDQSAKYAAIYAFGSPMQYNWETGVMSMPQEKFSPIVQSN
jgi:hypothetical protein